jgi:hypothetical protein
MDCGKKGTITIFGLVAALLAAGCSIKLSASSFAGFRVAPQNSNQERWRRLAARDKARRLHGRMIEPISWLSPAFPRWSKQAPMG